MNNPIAIAVASAPNTGLPVAQAAPAGGDFAGLLAELANPAGTKRAEQADVLSMLMSLIPAAVLQALQAPASTDVQGGQPADSTVAAQGAQSPANTALEQLLTAAIANLPSDSDAKSTLEALQNALTAQPQGAEGPAQGQATQEALPDMAAAIRALLEEIWPAASEADPQQAAAQTIQNPTEIVNTEAEPALAAVVEEASAPEQAAPAPRRAAESAVLQDLRALVRQAVEDRRDANEPVPQGLTALQDALEEAVAPVEPAAPDEGPQQQPGNAKQGATQAVPAQTTALPHAVFTPPVMVGQAAPAAPRETVEVRSGAELYDKLVQKISTMKAAGQEQMVIQLKPEALGRLTIRLTMGESGLIAQLSAANPRVQEQLSAQAASLQSSLSDQGLKDVRVIVTTTAPDQAGIDQQLMGQRENRQESGQRRGWDGLEGERQEAAPVQLFGTYEEAGRAATVNKLA